jgi:hypothetical protein
MDLPGPPQRLVNDEGAAGSRIQWELPDALRIRSCLGRSTLLSRHRHAATHMPHQSHPPPLLIPPPHVP